MKPCSLLIVEDHPFQHLYLQSLLNELGVFDVVGAGTAKRHWPV